jgi:hypothetical protein
MAVTKSGNILGAIAALTVLLFGVGAVLYRLAAGNGGGFDGVSRQEDTRAQGWFSPGEQSWLTAGIWILVASLIEGFCYCLRLGNLLQV